MVSFDFHWGALNQKAPYLIKVRGFLCISMAGFETTAAARGCCGDELPLAVQGQHQIMWNLNFYITM